MLRILITGANGFIAKNLIHNLKNSKKSIFIYEFTRKNNIKDLEDFIYSSEVIVHLAGENRSKNLNDFETNNVKLSKEISNIVKKKFLEKNQATKVIFSSSIQAEGESNYAKTKRKAEKYFEELQKIYHLPVYILRLMNVFGKWCRPNYNSVIATFCSKIMNQLRR